MLGYRREMKGKRCDNCGTWRT